MDDIRDSYDDASTDPELGLRSSATDAAMQQNGTPCPLVTDVDFILGLIDARASYYHSCSCTTQDEEDWEAERPLLRAKYEALRELSREIRACLPPATGPNSDATTGRARRLWVLSTEMGGDMTAALFQHEEDAMAAKERYMRDFRMEDEHASHATCGVEAIDIAPRRTGSHHLLDGRFALIMYNDGAIHTSLHETEEELEVALDEFMDWSNYGSDDSAALYGRHEILIPQ